MTFGESFRKAVLEYLLQNKLMNLRGHPSLGKINGKILGELADDFYGKWVANEKKIASRKRAAAKKDDPACQIPPTLEMVQQHMQEKGYTFSAHKFMAHYESNGWMVGKVRMKNWHGACVTFQGDQPKRPQTHANPVLSLSEPQGWQEIIREHESLYWAKNREWENLQPYYQKQISNLCQKQPA